MKKTSFSALLYREYVICKKALRTNLIGVLITTLFPVMISLSIRWGNLAMVPAPVLKQFVGENGLILKRLAAVCSCMLCMATVDASALEVLPNWNRFRRSTPVKPWRLALAKYVFLSVILAVSLVMALLSVCLCGAILDAPLTKTDIAVIAAALTVLCALSAVANVLILLLGSVDKGMLALLVLVAGIIFLLPEGWTEEFSVAWLLGFAENLLPWTVPVLCGVLALCWGLTARIYGRREK